MAMGEDRPAGPAAAGSAFRSGDVTELGSLDLIFGVHLGLAHATMVQDFKREVEALRVTPKQVALMWLADQTPGISQIEVARLLRVDRATILGITNNLVRRRMVARGQARQDGPSDARRVGLHLTPAGLEILHRAQAGIAVHEARFLQRLTANEVEQMLLILRKLYR